MALENFTGELDAPESGGYEVFTGELDSPAEVSQGRSASMADPRRLDNPANQPEQSFLSRVGDSITGLAKTAAATNPVIGRFLNISGGPREDTSQRSVLDDQPNVVGGVSPNDMAENERLSRRAYAEEVEQRQRIANSPSMRATVDATGAQAYADQNPVSAGLKSGTAKFLGGVLNAPSVAAGLATETVNRVATDAGGQPVFDRVGNMPLVEDLRKVSQDYASQLSRKSPGQAWDDGDFGRWMMSQMAENSPSAALSLAALFLPGAQAAVLGSMGASAAGSSYAEGDSAAAATLKGLVEVGSEKLPLSAAEKLKDIVLAIPAGSRNLVLAEAGKRLAAAGTAITANSLVGAIEESAAQIGGNAIDILIDKKTKNLFEDVDRAAIVGGAFGGAMSAPTLGALVSPESNRARERANAMNAGTLPAAGVTVDEALRTSGATLIPEATSISAAQAAAARQLEARALSERATTAVEEIQAKAVADIGKATSVDEAIASAQNAVSLDGPGMVDEALKAAGVNTADLNAVATQASADTAAAVRQQAAAEIAQEAAAQKAASSPVTEAPATSQTEESTQPVKIWVGRRGDGYATPEDASRGLKERERLSPDLDWTTEQMPDGRYRLAGYARTVAQPVAAPVSADPLANEILQAEQKLDAQMQRRPSGTLAITGASAPAIRTQLQKAGIPSVPINGGIEVGRANAARAEAMVSQSSVVPATMDTPRQETPRVPESAAQAPGPAPAAAGTTAPAVTARAAQPAVAAGVPAARGSANQAPAVDLTTAKPDRLLYLSRNPTSPLQEAAVKELRRREVDAAYRQREASRPAEEQAIVEEARDQQAAQETARSVAQESDAPSAMQVAMERARAKREGREQGIKFSIDGSQAQVQNQANEPSRSTPETGKRTVASRSPGTSEQQRIADDIAQRVSARLGRTLVLDVVAPGRGESSARNKEESATVLTAKRLFGQDVIFVRQSERVFHGLMSDAYPNTVFIDIDTDKPMMAVLGHELLHQLRKNQPGIYRQLDERLTALLKNPGEFLDRIEAQYRAKGMEVPHNWDEELFADVVGDNFTDPEFWTAMAESQPRLFQRVANAIRQFLNNVLLKAKPFGTDQFMSDVRAARDAVVDAMRQFSGAEVGAMTDQMDGIALSVADSTPAKQSSTPAIQEEAMTAPSEKWELPAATKTDRLIFELQDGRIDLKRIQEAITAAKREIGEGFNARLAETLFPGRVARQTENFLEVEAKPLLEFMAKNKVTQDELSDYLLARHAPERNAQIARVNDELQDGGAGTNSQGVLMTTQAANDYMAALPANKRTMLDMAAKRVDAITKGTRDLLVSSGLESQATVDAWTSVYENYVPLFKDEALETPAHPMGSGMSVTGKTTKRATGSTGEVTNMLAHVLMQREAAITRAEKNKVAMSLYGLALTNPNSDVWTTIRPSMPEDMITAELERMGVDPAIAAASMQGVPTIRGVDPQSGKVIDRPNPMYKRLDNAIVVKVNGEDRVILFNENNPRAVRLAQNLKNQDRLIAFDLAGSIVGKATRYFASINTQYNPAFGMVNIVRDVGGALVNLTDTKLAGQQAKVLGNSVPAMIGIARDLRGDPQRTPWSDLWQQFQDDGGRTGYRDLFADPYKRAEAVQSELDKLSKAGKLTPGAMAHAALDFLDDFNTTLENGIRLSAYKAALDDGMTGPQAARLARELTLDFNRKGRTGRELGPLYAFFNASVQGTARTVQALKGPAGAKIITGGLALGVIQALMLAAAGYEDDEIPEFIKARAFIIPLAGKQYIAIPLQFGLNALPNTGRVLTELAMSRGKDWAEKSFAAIGELAGSFNPLGGGNIFTAHGALTTVAPTIADPFIDLAQNRNFAGTPIAKETFPGDQRPGFTLGREGTQRTLPGQMYIGISKAINTAMGGNDFKKGIYSPKPEEVKYVFTTVGGGVYRELEKAFNAAEGMVSGRELKAREIPLGSRFGGEVEDADVQRTRYFKNSKKINALEAEYKGFAKAGRSEEASALMKNEPLAKLYSMNDAIARDIAQLNKLAATKIGDRKALEELDARRAKLYKILNDQVIKLEKAAEKAKRE